MKKPAIQTGRSCYTFRKYISVMRISAFLLFLTLIQVYAKDSYAQHMKLSVNFENNTLEEVLMALEEQSEFFFLYNEKLIDTKRNISLNAGNLGIAEILDKVFDDTDISYVIVDRKIVLAPGNLLLAPQPRTITGIVSDAQNEPLPGVTVLIKGTSIGTITDHEGKFALSVPEQGAVMQFSFVGMKRADR